MLDWASTRDIGFSHLVSLGSMSDVDFGDLLDYLALDANTDAILLYVEANTHARKFLLPPAWPRAPNRRGCQRVQRLGQQHHTDRLGSTREAAQSAVHETIAITLRTAA